MEMLTYVIKSGYEGISIRQLLESFYVGKSNIYKLFFEKRVYLNNEITNERQILKIGDVLGFEIEEEIDFLPWDKNLDVVYEDEYILIVDKPVGVIIHPDGENQNNTLVNIVASYYQKNNIHRQVRYIHRIDTETSGIVVFAKDFLTYAKLNHQIETHEVKREYLALVQGIVNKKEITINQPIGRDRHIQNKFRVGQSKNSKEAITHCFVEKNFKDYSLVRLLLETGRTHQIRVHMSYNGNPLLGDSLYGGNKRLIKRVALHSYRVTLINPITLEKVVASAPLHEDMKELVGE